MTAFLGDPEVPLENNFAERCLRGQALGRNNWLFAGSHQAGRHTAVAYTLVQTARLHGVDVLAYLQWALERVAVSPHESRGPPLAWPGYEPVDAIPLLLPLTRQRVAAALPGTRRG
jgi:hypothetical protein